MDKKTLKENHNGSLWKLLKIYNAKGDLYKGTFLLISLVLDFAFLVLTFAFKLDEYALLKILTDLYLTILPSLLGFNLGAYALLIGLASSELINKMSKSYETKFTSFQRASSVFGFCVLLQAVALIVSFVFKLEINLIDAATINLPLLSNELIKIINLIGIFIINFFGIYSIFILVSVVGSIFAISQAAHFFSVTRHIKIKEQHKIEGNE